MRLRRVSAAAAGLALALASVGVAGAATWDQGSTSRVSIPAGGGQMGAGSVTSTAISSNGRYVAFASSASNLVPGDTNGRADVFVRDRVAGTTKRVNVGTNGQPFGNDMYATDVIMSANGRYVAYTEYPIGLSADTDACVDIAVCYTSYWRDLQTGEVRFLRQWSIRGTGMSADGRYVALNAGFRDEGHFALIYDSRTNTSRGIAEEVEPRYEKLGNLSADGRYAVFLLDRDPTYGDLRRTNAYVLDTITREYRLLSATTNPAVEHNGQIGVPSISGDGTRAAFTSTATNHVSGDSNGRVDVFLRNLQTNTTSRINVGPTGQQATGPSGRPQLNGTGRYVLFSSSATNLLVGDTNGAADIFVRDTASHVTRRVSVTNTEGQANGASDLGQISSDGRRAAFASVATKLVTGDTNQARDVFLRDVAPAG